jgi:predicted signal transduction protein with EAL and GGDEF domain
VLPSSTICRTVVVLGYLVAVAAAGTPVWATAVAAVGLVGVWLAPLLLAHHRHVGRPVAVPALVQPQEAGLP